MKSSKSPYIEFYAIADIWPKFVVSAHSLVAHAHLYMINHESEFSTVKKIWFIIRAESYY